MADIKLSQLTLKTGDMVASDLLEITENGTTTKSVTGTKILGFVSDNITGKTLAQTLALGNTSGATDLVMTSGQKVTTNTIDETTAASGVTIDSVLVKDSTVTAGTLTIGGGTITDSSGAISFGNENLTTTGNVDANGVEFDSLSGTGGVAITDILDEDDMASDSATMLATQQSIKAYVDASSGAPEGTAVLSTGETGGTKFLREDGDGTSSWQIPPSGDITAVIAGTGISGGGTTGDVTITNSSPNATHTGEVTGATELTIADNVVDEANLKVSNAPTNGYFLSAQSGDTGGLTWAAAAGGGGGSMTHISTATISGTSTNQVVITGMDNTYKTYQLYAYWESQSGGPQTAVQLTDGGTRITTAVYNGSRQYNGAGSTLLGRTDMYILGAEINQCQLAEIYTFYMNGNNIEMVHRNQAAFLTLAAASPSVWIAQSCHALSSSYSASGNIDGISFTGSGGGALGDGSSFILYGLAE
jgi:hypothetical protein